MKYTGDRSSVEHFDNDAKDPLHNATERISGAISNVYCVAGSNSFHIDDPVDVGATGCGVPNDVFLLLHHHAGGCDDVRSSVIV